MKLSKSVSLVLVFGLGLLGACGIQEEVSDDPLTSPVSQVEPREVGPLKLMVSLPPQQYFAERIGGDRLDVSVLVEPGIEPETYEPAPQQLVELSDMDAFLAAGIFYENVWDERLRATNPDLIWADTSEGIEKLLLPEHSHHDHGHKEDHNSHEEHSEEHDHSHDDEKNEHSSHAGHDHGDGLDPHTWLSPTLAKTQAENIYQLLAQLDPDGETFYAENLALFIGELDELDQTIRQRLEPLENRSFLVFHPAWGYFAADYNLEQFAIQVDGQEPSAAELAEVIELADEHQISTIITHPQANSQSVEAVAQEINGSVLYIDPIAPDWSDNLLTMTDHLLASQAATLSE